MNSTHPNTVTVPVNVLSAGALINIIQIGPARPPSCRVEDITEALWGTRMSPSTVSDLNKKIYGTIETWRNPADRRRASLRVPRRHRAQAQLLLVAIGVNGEGYREILGTCEGAKEDKAGWSEFLKSSQETWPARCATNHLGRLHGAIRKRCGVLPRCRLATLHRVHWYRNIFSHVPSTKVREIAAMLKAIHAGEDVVAARQKAVQVIEKMRGLRLANAAELVATAVEETLGYYDFPEEHWRRIRTTDVFDKRVFRVRS
jgi:transposase-like protein